MIGESVIIPGGTTLVCDPGNPKSTIFIEDGVLLGPNVAIYSFTHRFTNRRIPVKEQGIEVADTRLKSGCWIGINSVIMPGVTIGKNSVVGANSVVTKDVPDFSVVAGAPARIIRELPQ